MMKVDEKALAKVIGKAIARHRLAGELTQEQVAERLSIGNEAVSRMERGTVMPTVARLVELADIFNCEVTELLNEVSPRLQDQAQHLSQLLTQLDDADRTLVIEVVEKLVQRLGKEA
ncbi:transcriptional regulator with XRE-family HTH domain [Vogesella indigofera]|uniref:Transcriptional regulator with XRE-family HTH domain n=1 Tax=Vogesella indigofera TaxID=45465 RepID=A0A495BIF4_VOGIN|nr:helix-turn-helix transcriptional regulator [Vogesella indigofera]RKQ60795.1 transcriptional regulator with XRE-family HTH domain [Vogesella indigofera]